MNSEAEHRLAPGAPLGAYKECPPRKEAPVVSKGAPRRRLLRRAYCKWHRHDTHRNAVMGWDPIQLPPFPPKKPFSLGLNGSNRPYTGKNTTKERRKASLQIT